MANPKFSVESSQSWLALTVLGSLAFLTFVVKLYRVRTRFRSLQRQGLSMPPHSFLLGHIPLLLRVMKRLPSDAHGHYMADQIHREFPALGSMFYLDTWPFGPPLLVVISPTASSQFTQKGYLPKHVGMRNFLRPLTGDHDLVSMEGQAWKTWRDIFNPGFSAGHIMKLVPDILKEVTIFRDSLRKRVEQDKMFSLEEHCLNVTMDVIGRVALDVEFDCQTGYNDLTDALRKQIPWCCFGVEQSPLLYFNPYRIFISWYNGRRMDRYIEPRLEERYSSSSGSANTKSVMDLALTSYLEHKLIENNKVPDAKTQTSAPTMDATFKKFAISQMKLFIFTGHDTTASTICYVYHLLASNPSTLKKVREEHSSVFGDDLNTIESSILSTPHLLNRLPYTLAVIKETLRLFPVVSTPRAGQVNFNLIADDGQAYPTKDCLVWGVHHGLQRNPDYWPHPDSFIPERWTVGPEHALHPIKNAWRAFEWGARNCIGQELALVEIKMIMAMTLREFEFQPAFDEFDRLHPRPGKVKMIRGERAYQIILGSAHPPDGYPCRVYEAKVAEEEA